MFECSQRLVDRLHGAFNVASGAELAIEIDPRRLDAYKRGIDIYKRGLVLRKEPVEFVEVQYGPHKLPAYFMKAPVPGRAPCMVHFDGLDVTKEIIYSAVADEFRRRGLPPFIESANEVLSDLPYG